LVRKQNIFNEIIVRKITLSKGRSLLVRKENIFNEIIVREVT
jgi:hypothetical protein